MKTKIIFIITLLLIGHTLLGQKLKTSEEYDEQGFLRVEYQHPKKDASMLQGFYKEYYAQKKKKLKVKGQYENNEKIGLWEYYNKDGSLQKEVTFAEDKKNGRYSEYYFNDNKKKQGNYKNGNKDGMWTSYNTDGSISYKGSFIEDKKTGKWEFYYFEDKLNKAGLETEVYYEDNYKEDTLTSYYRSGKVWMKKIYKKGKTIGLKTFYESGSLLFEQIHEDTVVIESKEYYEDGAIYVYFNDTIKTSYYESGDVLKETKLKNDSMLISHVQYDKNGKMLDVGNYKDGNGLIKFYNDEGKLRTEANYKNYLKNGEYVSYNNEDKIRSKGECKKDRKVGTWQYSGPSGETKEVEEKGKNKTWSVFEEANPGGFVMVEAMPEFPGGQEAMLLYIYQQIKYPPIAKENNIEGRVIISFIVDELGIVKKPKIVRDVGGGCGDEALRVVNEMPRWSSGRHKGQAVKVQYNLPVMFRLE